MHRGEPEVRDFASLPWRGEVLLVAGPGAHEDVVAPLQDAGFFVKHEAPDELLINELHEKPPVLVVAILEGESTFTAITRVRQALGGFTPPVVAIVSGDDAAAFERAFVRGAQDVLSRPILPAMLRVKSTRLARRAASHRTIGPFSLRHVLGRGGMGTVYLATSDAGQVAIKLVEVQQVEPESLVRFHREVETLRGLEAPGVPRFIDAGRVEDTFYLAMEFVPGRTVHDLLDRGPLPANVVARIIAQVGEALGAIHEAGLVHRDVKPANVIVSPAGDATLVDFGLAKDRTDRAITRHDEVLGTMPYLAPELMHGTPSNEPSDAFALGITAFEALLGSCPISGAYFELAARIARGDIPRASALVRSAPPELLDIIDGLSTPWPEERLTLRMACERVARLVDGRLRAAA